MTILQQIADATRTAAQNVTPVSLMNMNQIRIELDGETIGRLVYEKVVEEMGRSMTERKYTG